MAAAQEVDAKHASQINENFVSKDAYEALRAQISGRDKQIEELKSFKGNVDELTEKIKNLQAENEEKTKNYEAKLKQEKLANAMKLALGGKVHDPDLTISQIDINKVSIGENGGLIGFSEQIDALRENKAFLFVSQENLPPKITGKPPENGGNVSVMAKTEPEMSYGKRLAEEKLKRTQSVAKLNEKFFGSG
jgi:DNA repair exonuclease SbcCD ATPase subunit